MEKFLFSALSPTVKVNPPEVIIKVRKEDDLQNLRDFTPRYEFIRGLQGNKIADLTEFKGVEDLGDKIKVMPGTKWKEIINYNPEIFCIRDFTVGGSVSFNDACFGFNEFGYIKDRVEVEAYIDGQKYEGKYKGGIISAVLINKENKEMCYKYLEGDFLYLANLVKKWFISDFPVFRDVTLIKENNKAKVFVSYTKTREVLVKKFIDNFQDSKPPYEDIRKHKFRYAGYITLVSFEPSVFSRSDLVYFHFRKNEVYYYAFSQNPLVLPNTTVYSDVNDKILFNGCILCGKCTEVCPHKDQRDSSVFSPLGFYVLSSFSKEKEVSNCHMCGKCTNVCPVDLSIVLDLIKSAKFPETKLGININLFSRRVIVLTVISKDLKEFAIKAFKILDSMGIKVGIITLDLSYAELIKSEFNNDIKERIKYIDEIITLTPEEFHFLSSLQNVKIIDVTFIYQLLEKEIKNKLEKMKVHVPCFYDANFKNADKTCSYEFLNEVNNEGYGKKNPNADISLCPLAARRLGIKNILDLFNVQIDYSISDKFYKDFISYLGSLNELFKDLEWYTDIDDNVKNEAFTDLIENFLSSRSKDELLLFYLNNDKYIDLDKNIRDHIVKGIEKLFAT
ncbi:4Fe-4S dicluster domain-containing protein [Acidianus brierleyi]|uniref:4Fe-4S ferredoxin n=1 Tax=Acidianus brierleyi TaxID=41673 RepID=A0A2U9IC20_9CREN|nr:4Fe-4S dicluster domain-containing protein [Acidianus brierleyi]AWR93557.1 4Fe-4S ferredoxin [Acidianus brierleyi]